MTESEEKYRAILNLPHHRSTVHPQMSIYDRAAQCSPFAALTGHEDAIKETARLTEEQVELDEDKQEELNEKLQTLIAYATEHPTVSVTYFKPDILCRTRVAGNRINVIKPLYITHSFFAMLVCPFHNSFV